MTRQERNAALFFVILGVAVVGHALAKLELGTLKEPGPAFFPVVCGVGIVVLAGYWLVASLKSVKPWAPLWAKGELAAPVTAAVLIVAYSAAMEPLGYLLSTVVFLVAWQQAIEREKWLKTGIIAVCGTAVMYLLFMYLLGVPLPEGMFVE